MHPKASGTELRGLSLSDLQAEISNDTERSVFLVDPDSFKVTQASPVSLEEFRKMGFSGTNGIIGSHVSELYENSAPFLFVGDRQTADGFKLQQREAWERIENCDSRKQVTSHVIGLGDGGRRITLEFWRIENHWGQVLAYAVEVLLTERLTIEKYLEQRNQCNLLLPAPLRRTA